MLLLGCSNSSNKLENENFAELNNFSVTGNDTVTFYFSKPIDISEKMEIRLLSPSENIKLGEQEDFSKAFGLYKFKIEFFDIKLDSNILKGYKTDPIITDGKGPIYIVQGTSSSVKSNFIFYIGVGNKKYDAKVEVTNNNVRININ